MRVRQTFHADREISRSDRKRWANVSLAGTWLGRLDAATEAVIEEPVTGRARTRAFMTKLRFREEPGKRSGSPARVSLTSGENVSLSLQRLVRNS
jgi:hypothetical protein